METKSHGLYFLSILFFLLLKDDATVFALRDILGSFSKRRLYQKMLSWRAFYIYERVTQLCS